MHLNLLSLALAVAVGLRWLSQSLGMGRGSWQRRWSLSLGCFALPPLLLLSTTLAIVIMGLRGQMWGMPVGDWSYGVSLGFLGLALGRLGLEFRSLRQTQHLMQTYAPLPPLLTDGVPLVGRLLPHDQLFAGQVGWWRSQLLLSQGVLDQFSGEPLGAIVAHEQAHGHYRDCFWFFWLNWLGQLTPGLPQTEPLWQELLLLREHRADAWAAQRTNALVLAETLVSFVQHCRQTSIQDSPVGLMALSDRRAFHRLEERVEALVQLQSQVSLVSSGSWGVGLAWGLVAIALPLITIPFHSS